MKKKLILLPK